MVTRVISVRGRKPAELEGDPDFVYIGRSMPRQGWKDQGWGNPFKVIPGTLNMRTPDQVCRRFLACLGDAIAGGGPSLDANPSHVRARMLAMAVRLPSLKGKTLGCWCCEFRTTDDLAVLPACHGVILACLAEGIEVRWEPNVDPSFLAHMTEGVARGD